MGLDMYLEGSKVINAYRPLPKEMALAIAVKEGLGLPDCANPLSAIETGIMTWRKSNAIHKWFVDNCQEGVDNCQRTELKLVHLEELHSVLEQLLGRQPGQGPAYDAKLAAELLPPCEGFFFGGTEIDAAYWEDVETTHHRIGQWIDFIKRDNVGGLHEWELFYRASW
jgi:hypothetical protein